MNGSMSRSQLLKELGLTIPVMQAPMAGVSTVPMAAEVAKTGALGSIPLATIDLTKSTGPVFDKVAEFKTLAGPAKVNLNFFAHDFRKQTVPTETEKSNWYKLFSAANELPESKLREEVPDFSRIYTSFKEFEHNQKNDLDAFIEKLGKTNIGVVSFHFGVPEKSTIDKFHAHKILVLACVTSVAEAQVAVEAGADGLVCQGYEAGGHRGNFLEETFDENLSTSALFQQIVAYSGKHWNNKQPFIIPAGGIVDGDAAGWYLSRGADAVLMGTVFVVTSESSAPPYISNAVKNGKQLPTVVTPLISGKNARALCTPFLRTLISLHESKPMPSYGYSYNAFKNGAKVFVPNSGFYLAGQNYHLIDTDVSAKDVVEKVLGQLKSTGHDYTLKQAE